MDLNEDLFDDIRLNGIQAVKIVPVVKDELEIPGVEVDNEPLPGPEPGEDSGLTEVIINLISDEWEAIQGYNAFKTNVGTHTEFISLIDDIAAEENNHIGMLQKMLAMLSPNVGNIAEGEAEAETDLKEGLISEDFDDEQRECSWCGETFDKEELNVDRDLGYLCDRCYAAIESRGEHLHLLNDRDLEEMGYDDKDDYVRFINDDDVEEQDLNNALRELFRKVDADTLARDLIGMVPTNMVKQVVTDLGKKYGISLKK